MPAPPSTTIQSGDRVTLHYTTRALEGGVIESTRGRDPLVFIAGGGEVIRGLSCGVIGMHVGEQRTLSIPPEQAFGPQRSELVQTLPRRRLPATVTPNDQLAAEIGDAECDVWVRRLMTEEALLDANHPLAGESLVIDVEVLDVQREDSRPR
jgi:peptidylprolyl isomerase